MKGVGSLPTNAAESWPERLALLSPERDLTYLQLLHAVRRSAGALDLSPGEKVAIRGPTDADWLITFLAIIEAGGIACPLSTRWPPEQVAQALRQIGCERLLEPPYPSGSASAATVVRSPEEPATIVFTSGSTGAPKAVVHSLDNHIFSALGVNRAVRLDQTCRWLLLLPPCHVGGLAVIFRCLLAGATLVLPGDELKRDIEQERVTHLSLVPTQLQRLLAEPPEQHALAAVLVGGGEVSPSLLRIARKLGLPARTSYAASEMASTICLSGVLDDKLRALSFRLIRISSHNEILVAGEPLFLGYLEGGEVRSARDADGWYHTGDTGELDGDVLSVTGRLDNMFISGGENIHPEAIERHLCALPGVNEAVVVPVRDVEFGHRPFAFVRADSLDAAALRSALEEVMPRFMVPVAFEPLPEQTTLKPDRQALKALAEERSA